MACLEVLPATFSTKQLKMICNDVKYARVSILTGGAVMYGQVRQKHRQRLYDLFRFHHWGFGSKQPRGAESPPVRTLDFGNVRTRIVFSEIRLYNYFCSS